MADEILRSKHGFGSLENIDVALSNGQIDAYDILFVKDKNGTPYVGWIDKDGQKVIVKGEEKVVVVDGEALPEVGEVGKIYIFNDEGYFWNGKEFINFCKSTDLTEFENRFGKLESDLKSLDTTVAGLTSEVTNIKSDISKVQDKVDEVQTEITGMKNDVANLVTEISNVDSKVSGLETELEKKANSDDVENQIEKSKLEAINSANQYADDKAEDVKSYTDEKIEAALSEHLVKKFEISDTPDGTIVNINEREIRIMCQENTVFKKQSVGTNGDPNCYYVTLRTYVFDDNVVGYREHLGEQYDSVTLTDLKTDKFGRKYQPTWLGIAKYDDETGTWNYYGKNSTVNKYIGWDYRIDWYDVNDQIIASDTIRINLSNEKCHFINEPYYVGSIMKQIDTVVEEKLAEVESGWEIVEF